MQSYIAKVKQLEDAINNVDAIIIGAGSGLSTAAGFTYTGKRFEQYFSDFIAKYHFQDMYTAGFYPFHELEEYWAYWSRYIYINRYLAPEKQTYKNLLELVKAKDYFVITTNVDHQFQFAGFDKQKLFYTQGDYGLFQCSNKCHNQTYDNEKMIKAMVKEQKNLRIPVNLIPHCPICNAHMSVNLRLDHTFVEDLGWHQAHQRYQNFINKYKDKDILFLELGVGYNTPIIIKYPFWKMCRNHCKALYVCINQGQAHCPDEIKERSLLFNNDIDQVISDLLKMEVS